MIRSQKMIVGLCMFLSLNVWALDSKLTQDAGASINTQKKLKEVSQKRRQASEKRHALAQQLALAINECNIRGVALTKDLAVLVQELTCLEHISNKKRTGEQIKEAREKLESAKKHFARAAANDGFAKTVKELEDQLVQEEKFAAEEAVLRSQVCVNCGNSYAEESVLSLPLLVKSALAFGAGAATIALLHWRKFITIPQA